MIRRPPRSTLSSSSAASDVYKRQEGFVAIRSGQALKLVDRLEFSRANFTADKNWEKGNPMPAPKI